MTADERLALISEKIERAKKHLVDLEAASPLCLWFMSSARRVVVSTRSLKPSCAPRPFSFEFLVLLTFRGSCLIRWRFQLLLSQEMECHFALYREGRLNVQKSLQKIFQAWLKTPKPFNEAPTLKRSNLIRHLRPQIASHVMRGKLRAQESRCQVADRSPIKIKGCHAVGNISALLLIAPRVLGPTTPSDTRLFFA